MKILHLLQSRKFSGAENVACQIIAMMKEEADVQMAYCSRDGQIREVLKERGICYYPIKKLTVSEVKRIIRQYKPDIIHAHDMRASFIAAKACGQIPLISHIHNNAFDARGLSVKSVAYIYAALKAKHIFWVSGSSYKGYCFHSLFKKKSSVLYNIVDAYNKTEVERAKKEHRKAELLPKFSAHVMRHTACTRMAECRMDVKVLQYIMGHAHIDVTMEVYNHIGELTRIENEIARLDSMVLNA